MATWRALAIIFSAHVLGILFEILLFASKLKISSDQKLWQNIFTVLLLQENVVVKSVWDHYAIRTFLSKQTRDTARLTHSCRVKTWQNTKHDKTCKVADYYHFLVISVGQGSGPVLCKHVMTAIKSILRALPLIRSCCYVSAHPNSRFNSLIRRVDRDRSGNIYSRAQK